MTGKLTKCKACGKEVSETANVCPHCGQKHPGITGKATAIGCLVIVVIGVIIGVLALLVGEDEPLKDLASKSLEYKLATLNAEKFIDESDVTVARFRYLLNTISERTGDTRERVGEMTLYTQKRLREEYGKEIGLLELMEEAHTALSSHDEKVKYQDLMAMMLIFYSQ